MKNLPLLARLLLLFPFCLVCDGSIMPVLKSNTCDLSDSPSVVLLPEEEFDFDRTEEVVSIDDNEMVLNCISSYLSVNILNKERTY
jgi:hypothetical protein